MANPFAYSENKSGLHGLVYDMIPVTPNDGADNVGSGNCAVGLFIQDGGTLKFNNVDGNTRTITVPDSFYLTCSVSRVWATGTAATNIHALVV
ncbi:MAG: hypothetical protein NZ730_06510 [Porticoccaceae bacterium]|nr:hypothetical protein [Porticoccaceae bacterium]